MSPPSGPPRVAQRILAAVLGERDREAVMGDLEEDFRRLAEHDVRAARRRYRGEVLAALGRRGRDVLRAGGSAAFSLGRPGRILADLRVAARTLARQPVLSLVVVGTLTLSVGALTAIVSIVDGVLLRPLPFPEPERLVWLCSDHPSMGGFCGASPPDALDWSRAPAVEDVGLIRGQGVRMRTPDGLEGLAAGFATPSALRLLGARTHLGRLYDDVEQREAQPVVVLSHEAWSGRFGADPDVVGRNLDLDGRLHEVVGVLEPGTWVPTLVGMSLFRPLPFDPADESNRGWRGFRAIARLAPGARVDVAGEQLASVAAGIGRRFPDTNAAWGVRARPLESLVVGSSRSSLQLFLAAVILLLAIACANVTAILVAREVRRRGEMAVRTAIGATRGDLLRVLGAEALLLGSAGGALGALLARTLLPFLLRLGPALPRADEIVVDGRVLALVAAATLVVVIVTALVPAMALRTSRLASSIRSGGGSRSSLRVHRAIVVVETALAVVLLTGAALLGRTFATLMRYDGGLDRDHLLTAWLVTIDDPTPPGADVVRQHQRVADAVAALPGVRSAALASAGPLFGGSDGKTRLYDADGPRPPTGDEPSASWFDAGPGLFRTLGVPLLEGREFDERDDASSPNVVVINEAFARLHWPGESALGHRVVLSERDDAVLEVVGVVPDLPALGSTEPVEPAMYWPIAQWPRLAAYVLVRTDDDPANHLDAVWARAREVAPATQVTRPVRLLDNLRQRTNAQRFTALLMALFATAALLLTGLGVYGITAYAISRRTRELAIRLALGLERGHLRALVVRQALALTVAGVGLGLLLAGLLAAPLLEASLVGVSARDPSALAGAAGVVVLIGAVAAWIPGGRAARVDPATALGAD